MPPTYTDEQAQEMLELYTAASDEDKPLVVDQLAEKYGKSRRSIIGKLSKMGCYVKSTYKTKSGEDPIFKTEIVHKLATSVAGDPEKLQSLTKATKIELLYFLDCLERILD